MGPLIGKSFSIVNTVLPDLRLAELTDAELWLWRANYKVTCRFFTWGLGEVRAPNPRVVEGSAVCGLFVSAGSLPNCSKQQCALLNTHMAILTGSDRVTQFWPWHIRGGLLDVWGKTSAFLIKGTHVAGVSFLQQPFCHHEEKAKKITECQSRQTSAVETNASNPYLQTSCYMRKINYYQLKPLR